MLGIHIDYDEIIFFNSMLISMVNAIIYIFIFYLFITLKCDYFL